jgi:uncharacterized protein
MGHCHTSAQFRRNPEVFGAEGRTAQAVAAPRATAQLTPEAAKRGTSAPSLSAWILLGILRVYIVFLSPFFGGACKFYPSCSNYAVEAIARHGARRGMALAARRLLRCRPFTQGGFDPLPDVLEPPETEERKPPVVVELKLGASERRML